MKKFLSLVLALVMTMSLVTISAGAEDFTDNSDIQYEEAVDVMSAIGVVGGYADGSFNPEGGLTRGAAAKIICNMILGPTTADALSADAAPYKDVSVDNTFAGYIAYCAKEGIISGYADGTFRPAASLTGYAFMKMLLGALGYDADVEGYVGDNWSVNVAKRALNLELDDGLEGAFNGAKALTREEACLYAFNTLKADMVEYENSSIITVGDITVKDNSKAEEVTTGKNVDLIWKDDVLQFAEKYFDDLEAEGKTDDCGRPATKWIWDGESIGTYADDPDDILVVNDHSKALSELITDGDFLDIDDDDITEDAVVYYNGYEVGEYFDLTADTTLAGKGDIIETFENDDNDVYTIVIRSYTYAKIDSVDDELSTTLKNEGAEVEIELVDIDGDALGNNTYYDDHDDDEKVLNGFDADTYEEDVIIAVAINPDDGAIVDSYVAESVSGTPSAARAPEAGSYYGSNRKNTEDGYGVKNGTITIDGTKYNYGAQMTGVGFGETVDFDDDDYVVYLTAEGWVLAVDGDAVASLDDIYYVVGVYGDTVRGKAVAYAQVINVTDGTESEVLIDDDHDGDASDALLSAAAYSDNTTAQTEMKTGSVTVNGNPIVINGFYKLDKDGSAYDFDKYTGSSKYDTIEAAQLTNDVTRTSTVIRTNATTNGANNNINGRLYLDDSTFFISAEDIGVDLEISTANGIMTAETGTDTTSTTDDDVTVYAIYDDDDAVVVIYVVKELSGASNKGDIVYLTGDCKTKQADDTIEGNIVFMEDMSTKDIIIDVDESGDIPSAWDGHASGDSDDGWKPSQGFYTYNVSDGLYELDYKSGNVIGKLTNGEIDDDGDGFDMLVSVAEDGIKNNALTGTGTASNGAYVAVSLKNATVIDTRGASDKKIDAYTNTIDSISKLASASDKGSMVVDLYVEDGDIIFVAVVSCENAGSSGGNNQPSNYEIWNGNAAVTSLTASNVTIVDGKINVVVPGGLYVKNNGTNAETNDVKYTYEVAAWDASASKYNDAVTASSAVQATNDANEYIDAASETEAEVGILTGTCRVVVTISCKQFSKTFAPVIVSATLSNP